MLPDWNVSSTRGWYSEYCERIFNRKQPHGINRVESYDFSTAKLFWLGAAILSVICALFVWNAKKSRD